VLGAPTYIGQKGGKYHTNKENKSNTNVRRRRTKVGPIGILKKCNTTTKRKAQEGKQYVALVQDELQHPSTYGGDQQHQCKRNINNTKDEQQTSMKRMMY